METNTPKPIEEGRESVLRSDASSGVLQLKTKGGGLLAIRKDAVISVEASSFGGRNLKCAVNGIETESGYDFVLWALGWTPEEII
jgi:hypothetical protein